MATPQKPDKSEAVAVARPTLSPATEAMLLERRARNEVARQLANLSWGKGLSGEAQRSIAEYCRRYRLDPATEIDILGGRIYRKAEYYIRRGAELLRDGVVDDIQKEHINVDERLVALAARGVDGAQAEMDRRELQRIKHNIPDAALGAVVVRVRLARTGAWLEGANDAGYGQDPVGKADPGKTAETRAYRRVWKLLVDTVPELREEEAAMEAGATAVASVVKTEAQHVEELAVGQPGRKQLTGGAWAGYGDAPPAAAPVVVEREPGDEPDSDAALQAFDQALAEEEGQQR